MYPPPIVSTYPLPYSIPYPAQAYAVPSSPVFPRTPVPRRLPVYIPPPPVLLRPSQREIRDYLYWLQQ